MRVVTRCDSEAGIFQAQSSSSAPFQMVKSCLVNTAWKFRLSFLSGMSSLKRYSFLCFQIFFTMTRNLDGFENWWHWCLPATRRSIPTSRRSISSQSVRQAHLTLRAICWYYSFKQIVANMELLSRNRFLRSFKVCIVSKQMTSAVDVKSKVSRFHVCKQSTIRRSHRHLGNVQTATDVKERVNISHQQTSTRNMNPMRTTVLMWIFSAPQTTSMLQPINTSNNHRHTNSTDQQS